MVVDPVACPSIVGRVEELRELLALRLAATRGHGGLVLVSGESGIGKSRLIRAFREELTGRRTNFGIGYAREFGNPPYGPILEALQEIGGDPKLLPALSQAEQMALLGESVTIACRRRNATLVVEDLQWADRGTLKFLVHLLPALASLPLLVAVTYRSDELCDRHVAAQYLARLQRYRTREIVLDPLPPREMRTLLRQAMASSAHHPCAAGTLEEIVERAEGNPFFAEELLKNVLERRGSERTDALPLTVRAAIRERLARLSAGVRRIAKWASILDRQFSPAFLARIAERPLSEVLAALQRLCEEQIVEARLGGESFAFRHSLTRDVIYGAMRERERRAAHGRVLRLLGAMHFASAQDLGYHAWAAGDRQRCLFYNEQAGDEACGLHAYADAARCFERALEQTETPGVRSRLAAKAATAWSRDGSTERAQSWYADAIAVRRSLGDTIGAANLRGAMAMEARAAGDNTRAGAILSQALSELDPCKNDLRARLSLHLACCLIDRGDVDAAQSLIVESADAGEASLYWSVTGYAAAVKGDVGTLRDASARYLEASSTLGRAAIMRARFNYAFFLCALGIDTEALAVFDPLLAELRTLRLPSLEMLACANAALVQARLGNLAEARALVERGLAVPEPSTTGPIALAAAALTIGAATGDGRVIVDAVSKGIVDRAFQTNIDSVLGRIAGPYARWLRAQGDYGGAQTLLAQALPALHSPFAATETLVAAMELGGSVAAQAASIFLPKLDALLGVPLYAATAAHMRALQAAADDERRRLCAAEAEGIYRDLRWPLHENRCAELRAGVRTACAYRRHGAVGESRGIGGLSKRESAIARLVADGASNKSIATRFHVNLRTVEKHLSSVYSKLGLRNRTQLVSLMMRQHGF